jgi:peptidoglycan/xylan/chitin deacetylase (PgdA/CDA1 family)
MTSPATSTTVCLSFDFDAVSPWLYWGNSSPSVISRGEFGARVGAPRVLALLERYAIPSTWFIPGHTIDTFPDQVRAVHAAGHEIGNHGYCHEKPVEQSPEDERRILERATEAIMRITGSAPAGYRSPSWELSPHSIGFLQELGFRYDSSLMGDDYHLYYCRRGDVPHRDSAYVFGQEIDLVEMPVSWVLDDFPQFEYVRPQGGGLKDPDQVFNLWRGEFDYVYEHEPGGVFILTMHPQVIGRGPRILMLERLIQYMRERSGVRFAKMGEVAEAWRQANPLPITPGAR